MRIPKIETLVIIIIFFAVGLWAFQRCSSKRSDLARRVQDYNDEQEDRPTRRDTVYVGSRPAASPGTLPQPATAGPATSATAPQSTPDASTASPSSRPAARPTLANPVVPPSPSTSPKGSVLYVTIDGLKVRKEPGLKGDQVAKLDLYEAVTFLNQKTEWTQELSLGEEKVTDHWVKIRTKSGKEGWVFGAGVHYYKTKR